MAVTPGHGGGTAVLPVEKVMTVVFYAILGAAYALMGYWKKREQGRRDYGQPVPFSTKRFVRTAAIGAVAGVIVAWQGEQFSGAAMQTAMATAVPVVDQLLNRERAKREQVSQAREQQQNQ